VIHEIHRVTRFEQVADFTLKLDFDDGTSQTIDFAPVLRGALFGPRRNHRLIAEGRPNEIFNAEVLREAYSGELVVFHQDGMVMIGERPHAPHI